MKASDERGSAIVDFLLVSLLVTVLMLGVVQLALTLHVRNVLIDSAAEGARYAAVTCGEVVDDSAVIAKTEEAAADLSADVSVTVDNCPGESTESVVVEVEYDYELITPLGGLLSMFGGAGLPDTITLTSSSDMRVE